MIDLNNTYNEDCIKGMYKLNDKSVDLIIADIPYNMTDNSWDKFDTMFDYINFLGDVFYQFNRILKKTGSLYIFHSDFQILCEINNLMRNNTGLSFQQLIVWNKLFDGCNNKYLKDVSLCRGFLKNYVKFAEYILFYVFEEKKKKKTEMNILSNFPNYKAYMKSILDKKKYTYNSDKIVRTLYEKVGYKSMQGARGISERLFNFNFKNFGMITKKQYEVLKDVLDFDKTYEELYKLFLSDKEVAVKPKEEKRVHNTFNVLGNCHSVWNYDIPENMIHPTQKPVELIENIVLHSSNENDIILDPFMGCGTTAIACIKNNRNYIGFDNGKDEDKSSENYNKYWSDIANKRVENYKNR